MTIASAILATSPAVYWKLDELSGTTAADSSGNGHAGVVSGDVTLGLVGPEVDSHAARLFATGQIQSDNLLMSGVTDFSIVAYASVAPSAALNSETQIAAVGTPLSSGRGPSLGLVKTSTTIIQDRFRWWPSGQTGSFATSNLSGFWHAFVGVWSASSGIGIPYIDGVAGTSTALGGVRTALQTTDKLTVQSSLPVVVSHVAVWPRQLSAAEITSISSFASDWPYSLPLNTPLGQVTLAPGQIDLTPVTTDLATILSNWVGLQTVTMPSLQDVTNAIAAQVTAVQTSVNAIQFPNLSGLVTIPSLDSLTMTELTSGSTTDEFSHDIAGTIWGIVVRCTTVPDWYGMSGPGAVWHQPALARISIVRGVDELYSELIHNDHYLLTPVPGAITGVIASLVLPPIEQPGTSVFVVFNQGVAGHVYYLNLP